MLTYDSPLGPMTLAAETGEDLSAGGVLVGVWFDGQRHDRAGMDGRGAERAFVIGPGRADGAGAPPRRKRQPRATAAERVTPAGNDPRKLRLSALKGLWRFFSQAEPVAFPFFP